MGCFGGTFGFSASFSSCACVFSVEMPPLLVVMGVVVLVMGYMFLVAVALLAWVVVSVVMMQVSLMSVYSARFVVKGTLRFVLVGC